MSIFISSEQDSHSQPKSKFSMWTQQEIHSRRWPLSLLAWSHILEDNANKVINCINQWFLWVGLWSTEFLTQTTNSFHVIDYTALSLQQHFFRSYLLGMGRIWISAFRPISFKVLHNNHCIPFTLDKALWAREKFIGFYLFGLAPLIS